MKTDNHSAGNNTKDLVLSFIDNLNKEQFTAARKYLNDGFTFKGVMGNRDGADVYMKDMEKMKFKYNLKKVVADDADVSVLYEFTQGVITLPGSAWYHLKNSKIDSLNVLFDPRPILEASTKK